MSLRASRWAFLAFTLCAGCGKFQQARECGTFVKTVNAWLASPDAKIADALAKLKRLVGWSGEVPGGRFRAKLMLACWSADRPQRRRLMRVVPMQR